MKGRHFISISQGLFHISSTVGLSFDWFLEDLRNMLQPIRRHSFIPRLHNYTHDHVYRSCFEIFIRKGQQRHRSSPLFELRFFLAWPLHSLFHLISVFIASTLTVSSAMAFIGVPVLPGRARRSTKSLCSPPRRLAHRVRCSPTAVASSARLVSASELEFALQANERPLLVDAFASTFCHATKLSPILRFSRRY